MLRKNLSITFVIFVLISSYSVMVGLAPEKVNELGKEDGVVETLTAVFFLLSALVMFYLFIKSSTGQDMPTVKARKNYSYLLLGLFFVSGKK